MINVLKALWLSSLMALSGCAQKSDATLYLITNSWIGYSPLFYAKEKGWLDEHNIHLTNVVSLGESLHIYQNAQFDAFTGTQYEYQIIRQKEPSTRPILLLDRSNGGDMIMANRSLNAIRAETAPIDVYLEINSVNTPVFKDFITQYHLENKHFNYINSDHLKLQSSAATSDKPTLVVTYTPYNHQLEKQGFQTLAATGNDLSLLVVDALFTTPEAYRQHRAQFLALKQMVHKAIEALHKDPKAYYNQVKPYLENTHFEDFQASLRTIEWLHHDALSPTLKKRLIRANFPLETLL